MNQNQENQNQNEIQLLPNQRLCPNLGNYEKCRRIISYNSEKSCKRADRSGNLCYNCSNKRVKIKIPNILTRNCPNPLNYVLCDGKIEYKSKYQCNSAILENRCCKKCSAWNKFQINRSNKLENLLDESPISLYWIGFLLADGSFGDKSLHFGLKTDDLHQVLKFKNFIESDVNISTSTKNSNGKETSFSYFSIIDINKIIAIKDKFNIKSQKTYHAPDFNFFARFDYEQLLSLFIGLIDGDGCIFENNEIYKNITISILCHSAWASFYSNLLTALNLNYKTSLGKYFKISIHTFSEIQKIKEIAIKLNLPILNRKWDKINNNITIRHDKLQLKEQILLKFQNGFAPLDLFEEFNLSKTTIYNYYNEFKK